MGPFTAYAVERVIKGYERGEKAGMEAGMQKGMEAGMQKGMKAGIKEAKTDMVIELLKEGSLSDAQIMRVAKITDEELNKIKADMMCLV